MLIENPLNQKTVDDGELRVFISYARPDQAVAKKVEAFLTAAGVRVFLDIKSIPPGANWNQTIEKALRECQRMVLLLSPDSMPEREPERKEVEREWFYFDQERKPIYPLFIRDCKLNSRFVGINYIDARSDLPGALERLLGELRRDLDLSIPAPADNLTEYRRARIAEWSQPRYQLDHRFVNLTLTLDRGEDEQQRWQRVEEPPMKDLRDVLEKAREHPALVLLGAPGSGKSTLLRRLQLDHSQERLDDGAEQISFFIQLNEYRGEQSPREWLTTAWAERYPQLPPLETWLQKGRALLLLDALNEMPPKPGFGYSDLVVAWKTFVQQAARAGNRLVFSCRSLDYGAPLSSKELPVPLVNVQPMTAEQVREFLKAYAAAHEQRIWNELDGSKQFSLFQTPYFLKLLCEQVGAAGELPKGRAGLFTGFVRKALARETDGELFQPGALLSERDHQKLARGDWRDHFDLPERGLLIPSLSHLAFAMQENGSANDGAQVRIEYDDACRLIAHDPPDDIIKAGLALNVLDEARDEIAFFHQLLQEYFAARRLAKDPNPALVHVEWATDKVSPTLEATLAGLADGDPLPPLPQTGWEETTLTAAPMAKDPQVFIRDLILRNLPLAARCAASPELTVNDELKREIQQALVARTQDMKADLRARIAAGEALGLVGDPRFERRAGPHGDYLLPPL
ncbi:MAG: NACHT domain-containing protein, partial [Blastocatellia bacterium]